MEREREKGKGNIKVPTHDQVTPERDACGGGQYLVDILMNKYIHPGSKRQKGTSLNWLFRGEASGKGISTIITWAGRCCLVEGGRCILYDQGRIMVIIQP